MNSLVAFFSAQRVNRSEALTAALARVVGSYRYVLGQEVLEFEAAFAAYCGVGHCVGLGNGTDAIEMALRAVGVVEGSTVVLAANAGFYGSAATVGLGAKCVYVDVDPVRMTLCPVALASALADVRPSAVLVTHLYGQLADVPAIKAVCDAAGVPLVEDCAQAHGAMTEGRRAGAWGRIACFSFYPTKNLGALGDGGAIVTDDETLAGRVRQLRQYGWSSKYKVALPGGRNSRLDELQAAVLLAKLPMLDADNGERRAIALRYSQAFSELPLQLPEVAGEDHVAHLYVVRTPRRDALRRHLESEGIGCDVHYPIPDHQQPVNEHLREVVLPVTEKVCAQVLSLPCYPGFPEYEQQQVVGVVKAFFA